MDVTYEIKSGKNTHKYYIDGIEKRPRVDQEDRWTLLLQIIAKNPMIPHTHVIKIAQYLASIAKRTIEKELERSEADNFLRSHKKGTSPNAPRLWELLPPEMPEEKRAKKLLKELVDGMESAVIDLEKKYLKIPVVYRYLFLYHLFSAVNGTEFLFISTEWIIDLSDQRKSFDKLKLRCNKLLQNDPDFNQVFNVLSKRIIPETTKSIELLVQGLNQTK